MNFAGLYLKRCFNALGVDLVRSGHGGYFAGRPASPVRAVGGLTSFLEDVAARGFKPTRILDVGANRGLWSAETKRVFPHAKFTLIEPQSEMKPFLDEFCSHSPGSRWINAGAGAAPGSLPFRVSKNDTSSSFAAGDALPTDSSEVRSVPIVTLDSLYEDPKETIPELVKIDVEGFELEVLKGAKSLLGRTELFLLEVAFIRLFPSAPELRDIVAEMGRNGYSAYDLTWFYRRPSDGALQLGEVVFARDDGPLRAAKL